MVTARLSLHVRWSSPRARGGDSYQRIWNLGPALKVDGIVGRKTSDALRLSYARHKAGKPDISAHFRAREFQCKCFGRYAGCRRIWTPRKVVQLAERIRNCLLYTSDAADE